MKLISGVYIAEIADKASRRILGPLNMVGTCVGFFIGYTISAFVNWRLCKLILGSTITIPAGLVTLLLHETPHWLVKNGLLEQAK